MQPVFRPLVAAIALSVCLPVFAADNISAQGVWTRATPPGAANSATYAQLYNNSSGLRTLVSVSTSAAKEVQLHTVLSEDGLMKMREVPYIHIPAEGMVEFKPGGYHIMMLGIHEQLRDGESVDVELTFADGDTMTLTSEIKKMAGMKTGHGHSHGMRQDKGQKKGMEQDMDLHKDTMGEQGKEVQQHHKMHN